MLSLPFLVLFVKHLIVKILHIQQHDVSGEQLFVLNTTSLDRKFVMDCMNRLLGRSTMLGNYTIQRQHSLDSGSITFHPPLVSIKAAALGNASTRIDPRHHA